jgi:hypothetical protein
VAALKNADIGSSISWLYYVIRIISIFAVLKVFLNYRPAIRYVGVGVGVLALIIAIVLCCLHRKYQSTK